MAKLSTLPLLTLFVILALRSLTSCHNNAKPVEKFGFKDEKSMRGALQGSWILQEYGDSMDAGLTPKLLEYLLEHEHSINYYPGDQNTKLTTGGPYEVEVGSKSNNIEELYSVKFDFKTNRVLFFSKADSINGKTEPKQIAIAEFVPDLRDTLLMFSVDTNKPIAFVKYDNNSCIQVAPYIHLANSRFIAGKYHTLDDPTHLHHIVLTKCSNIEGAENISPLLKECKHYEVQLGKFGAEGDAIQFIDAKDYTIADMNWRSNNDSLILTFNNARGKAQPIVLIKY